MTRSLVRWNPRGTMFRNPMGRLIDEAFNDFLAPVGTGDESLGGDWMPPVDILEDDTRLVFTAEMPGLERENVEITLEDQVLTLRGERKFECQRAAADQKKRTPEGPFESEARAREPSS